MKINYTALEYNQDCSRIYPKPMKKLTSQTQPGKQKSNGYLVNVGLDSFGNAIPDTGAKTAESLTQRVVARRDVWVGTQSAKTTPKEAQPSAWWNIIGFSLPLLSSRPDQHKQLAKRSGQTLPITNEAPQTTVEMDQERVALVFKTLQDSFNEREARLDNKLRALEDTKAKQAKKTRLNGWVVGGMLAGASGIGIVLFIMASMKESMNQMSSSIETMNQHMSHMAVDTGTIAQSVHTMNDSMYFMNHNVANMNGNIGHMNQQVGSMAHSIAPMGEAAAPMGRFSRMFQSFFPF